MGIEKHIDSPLAEAVRAMKGQSPFARLVGRNQSTIYDWLRLNRPIPAELCRTIWLKTDIPMARLRPDLFSGDPPSPSLGDGSVMEGAPVVLSDRGAEIDRSTPIPRGDA
jgi:hypothetical protein